jgi:hypothetical protein
MIDGASSFERSIKIRNSVPDKVPELNNGQERRNFILAKEK